MTSSPAAEPARSSPQVPIGQLLHVLLPWLSVEGRAVISALVVTRGRPGRADAIAAWVGLGDRFRLARTLRGQGLPPIRELADWVRILHLIRGACATGSSLPHLLREDRGDVATEYRRVKRLLGVPWSVASARGLTWVLQEFVNRCRPPLAHATSPWITPRVLHANPPAAPPFWNVPDRGRAAQRFTMTRRGHPRGEVAFTAPLTGAPFEATFSGTGVVYVTRPRESALSCLDLRTGSVLTDVPVGPCPTRVVLDPRTRRAYVANQFGSSISVIDVATNRPVDHIPVEGDPGPVLLSPNGRVLYITANTDMLYAIEVASKRVLATFPLPATSHHLALNGRGTRLYVATRAAGGVMEIDTRTNLVCRTIAVGGRTQALSVAADGVTLYVANELGGLDVVDLTEGTVTASLDLGGAAFGLALTPDNTQLYVGLVQSERVQVVDCANLHVSHSIPTGGVPREIAFDHTGTVGIIVNEAGWVNVVT